MDSNLREKSEKIISGTLDIDLSATECVGECVLNAFGSNLTKTLGNSRVKLRCSRWTFLKADG